MDDVEISRIRQCALWRAKRLGKTPNSLWAFENWHRDPIEGHHIGGRLVAFLIGIPVSMHRELTRRRMEEHPLRELDPQNPVVQQCMLHFDMCDLHEGVAAGHRLLGDLHFAAARSGKTNLSAVTTQKGLLPWLCRISQNLAAQSKIIFEKAAEK